MPLRALYVDFNSYFASAEQQFDPQLRGRPVGVLPVLADTTCCIAASHEAKRRGVKTGTLVSDARKLCPDIRFVEARPAIYVDLHHRLVEAIESCLHVDRVMSIDEVSCRLTGSDCQRSRALALADRIKRAIAERVGTELRSSIGIAPNIFLAKVASDMQKPDGCVVIEDADLPDCLYGLALRDLCGIGKAMEQRLNRAGIRTVRDLCSTTKEGLRHAWGSIEGERFHARLRGEEVPDLPSQRGSVGHSHVLPPELRTPQAAFSILHRLLQKAAMRLRSYGCSAGAMQVKVTFRGKSSWGRQAQFEPTSDTLRLLDVLEGLWREFPDKGLAPLAVAVTLSRLDAQGHHPRSLFDEGHSHDKLNAIIDSLNLRYGKNTLYFGGAHAALHAAPMRIAFGHIPDLEVEGDD
ncbi:MAG: DNA polymerase [Rhodocyclales bacterium]|jgi:DNA polymerase-4|nr:MAG: DNA polymerase [Rhodocyclales bacterium]